MAGEISAVRRLEVAQRPDSCGEVVALPLQVAEHFAAPSFDLTIKLLGPAQSISLKPLGIDAGFGLDPLRTRTGVGGELVCGPVGFLPDPVGVLGGLNDRRSACSVDISTRRTTAELASLPVVTTIVPDWGWGGAGCCRGGGA